MNKAQIKAELRRSACEDKNPALQEKTPLGIDLGSWYGDFVRGEGWISDLKPNDCRTLFLLIAEAL